MLSKTPRKDVAKDKASEVVSAAADAAEAGREKLAPVVENVTGHLSDAAGAAAPHVAKAKDTVVESAAPKVAKAKEAAAEVAGPRVAEAGKKAKKQAKKAKKAAADAADAARAEDSGLSTEQARRLFNDEWMPRVHEAIAAAGAAGTTAYAALPDRARDTVEAVAPEVVKKRRKKGKLLIALGLLAGAGAVALYLSGNKGGAKPVSAEELPEVERRDVQAAEDHTVVPTSDDAVGDAEKTVDAEVSGSRRGRHAAKE